jgi:hypothetical protein
MRRRLFLLNLSCLKSAVGWCRPFSLVWLGLLSLACLGEAGAVLNQLGSDATTKVQTYGSAVILLAGAITFLVVLGFISVWILNIVNNNKSD